MAIAENSVAAMRARANQELAQRRVEAVQIIEEANRQADEIRATTQQEVAESRGKAKESKAQSLALIERATSRADQIVKDAEEKTKTMAGDAYDAMQNVNLLRQTAQAMRNVIKGYGDEYLRPSESLLDELAIQFGHKEAGKDLELARKHTLSMITDGSASECDYVEVERKVGAERFVLDAFNGKVDSILSRVKHDNYGKLEQEIRDALVVVNYQGKAFRNARITERYLDARLRELQLGSVVQELKRREAEEQRQIREQIKEEQKALREMDRARKEAEKEEETIRKAMERAQAELLAASEEQRVRFEEQLKQLQEQLLEAEERGRRAASMAMQTKKGHVYIISNIGSFGENVFKIGLTRRLEPLDRVKELGDASVPFPFDVHAMILCEDAPAVEHQLHRHFVLNQVNKVNYRKEFFRAELSLIRQEIEALGLETKWTMLAEATEYRESQAIEKLIASDPAAREAWMNRQLTLDVSSVTANDENDEGDES